MGNGFGKAGRQDFDSDNVAAARFTLFLLGPCEGGSTVDAKNPALP